MKIFLKGRKISDRAIDCKGFMSMVGLRFKKSFKPDECYIIHMTPDAILDSFFVNFEFIAAWTDNKGKILKIEKCKKNRFFAPIIGQSIVYEFPIDSKFSIKKGDTIKIKK